MCIECLRNSIRKQERDKRENVLRSPQKNTHTHTLKANKWIGLFVERPIRVRVFMRKNQFARGVWLNPTINMYAVIIYRRRKMEKLKVPLIFISIINRLKSAANPMMKITLISFIFFQLTFVFSSFVFAFQALFHRSMVFIGRTLNLSMCMMTLSVQLKSIDVFYRFSFSLSIQNTLGDGLIVLKMILHVLEMFRSSIQGHKRMKNSIMAILDLKSLRVLMMLRGKCNCKRFSETNLDEETTLEKMI